MSGHYYNYEKKDINVLATELTKIYMETFKTDDVKVYTEVYKAFYDVIKNTN